MLPPAPRAPAVVFVLLGVLSVACSVKRAGPSPEPAPPRPPPEPAGPPVRASYVFDKKSDGQVDRFPAIQVTDAATGAVEKLGMGKEADEIGHVELSPDGARFVVGVEHGAS